MSPERAAAVRLAQQLRAAGVSCSVFFAVERGWSVAVHDPAKLSRMLEATGGLVEMIRSVSRRQT